MTDLLGSKPPANGASPVEQKTHQDFVVLRLIAVALGMVALTASIGTMVLAGTGNELPEGITALGSASVGALATMLTTRRSEV